MMQDAQESNLVHEDTTLVEPTSGNTGVGVALNCALSGEIYSIVPNKHVAIK